MTSRKLNLSSTSRTKQIAQVLLYRVNVIINLDVQRVFFKTIALTRHSASSISSELKTTFVISFPGAAQKSFPLYVLQQTPHDVLPLAHSTMFRDFRVTVIENMGHCDGM